MLKGPIRGLILLSATLALSGCVSAPVSVQRQAAGCAALLPATWRQPVSAPEFEGEDTLVGSWIAFADAAIGRLDQANDRTVSAIGIVERCEARDNEAVARATRKRFLGIF
jgi:hypothetical protein